MVEAREAGEIPRGHGLPQSQGGCLRNHPGPELGQPIWSLTTRSLSRSRARRIMVSIKFWPRAP